MSYDPRVDCANSNKWVHEDRVVKGYATCTRCKQEVPVSDSPGTGDRGGWLFVHLRPGKTLADRR